MEWRKDPVILARLPEVERRHLRGDTNVSIAAALEVDEKTVRNDLERIRTLWRERVGAEVVEMRAAVVAELDDVRRRAIAAAEFDEQMERAVLLGEKVGESEVQRDDKGSAQFRGNKAASLGQARQATMDKAKVLGLVVDKVSPTDAEGNTMDLAGLILLAKKDEPGAGRDS